jgi:hypothetical protein
MIGGYRRAPAPARHARIAVVTRCLGYRRPMLHRRGRSSARVAVVALTTAVLGATGLLSEAEAASGSRRPEGRWTIVSWAVSREPASPDFVPGTASVSQAAFSPQCGSGPCAVRVRPAGRSGTYVATDAPLTRDADRGAYRIAWDKGEGVYTAHRDRGRVLCTTGDGAGGVKRVPGGYTQTTDVTYRFRPAGSGTPASITGERVSAATGTAVGAPQGCSDFRVTASVAGSPTGSVKVTPRAAAGHYRITEVVDRTEPAGQRPHGFSGILVPDSTVTAKGRGLTLTGVIGTATLRPTRKGWTGSASGTQPSCVSTSTEPGFDAKETWTGIHPVARTESGAPILVGTWRYVADPTASGVRDGCSPVTNRGYVILVPLDAIGS